MVSLRGKLAEAMYMEETEMIEVLNYIMRKLGTSDMDEDAKRKAILLLNGLYEDTLRHSRIISESLMRMAD